MIDKTLEALERLMPLFEKSMRELVFTAEKAGEVTADMNTLRAALAAPSAGPPAPIAGVTAIYCGWGCSCVTQCGDTYDYAGQPKPPLRPAAPAQPPAALETCQNCGDLPYPGCSSEFQGEPSCRFWPAAAPSVEAEPVLDRPARVGNATFGVGVATRLVVEAAQRQHEYHAEEKSRTPEQWREMERNRRALWDMLNGTLDAAPLQQPQEGWVSVEERLPEKFVEVLVAFADSSLPSTGQYTANPNDHDGWCYPKENCDWMDGSWPTVTHWMPLPDHPHEELFAPPAATNQNGAGDA